MAQPPQEARSQRTRQTIRTGSEAHVAGLCATPPRCGGQPRMRWAWRGAKTGSAASKPWVTAASRRCVHGRRSRGNAPAHGPKRGQWERSPRPTPPNKCCPNRQQPATLAPRSAGAWPAGRPKRPSRSAGDGGRASSTWGRDSNHSLFAPRLSCVDNTHTKTTIEAFSRCPLKAQRCPRPLPSSTSALRLPHES